MDVLSIPDAIIVRVFHMQKWEMQVEEARLFVSELILQWGQQNVGVIFKPEGKLFRMTLKSKIYFLTNKNQVLLSDNGLLDMSWDDEKEEMTFGLTPGGKEWHNGLEMEFYGDA